MNPMTAAAAVGRVLGISGRTVQILTANLMKLVLGLPPLRKLKEAVSGPGGQPVMMIENGSTDSSPSAPSSSPPLPKDVAKVPTNIEKLSKSLIEHEGMVLEMYDCPAGYKTIGVGRV